MKGGVAGVVGAAPLAIAWDAAMPPTLAVVAVSARFLVNQGGVGYTVFVYPVAHGDLIVELHLTESGCLSY